MKDRELHCARVRYNSKRFLLGILYLIFVLILLVNSLLQTTVFQNFIAKKASEILTEQLGISVNIEKLHLSLMMDVTLEGVLMQDLHQNDMIIADYLHFSVDNIDIRNLKFSISKLRLENAGFVLRKYENEPKYNISMVFPSDSTDTTAFVFPATILCGDAALHHCFFRLQKDSKSHKEVGFDYNHIALTINDLKADKILVSDEDYSFNIKEFNAYDWSGMTIENLATYMKFLPDGWYFDNMKLKTPTSDVNMDLKFAYTTFDNISEFVDSIKIIADIRPSVVDVKDIAYFSSSLSDFPIVAKIEGNVDGLINSLQVDDLKVSFFDETALHTTANLQGIMNPETAYMKIKIHDFKTTLNDINSMKYIFGDLDIPNGIIDTLSFKGNFTGTVKNFEALAEVRATCGFLKTRLRMWDDPDFNDYQYYGTLLASNIHAGESIGLNGTYKISDVLLHFDGFGTSLKTAEMDLNGELCGIYALGYEYDTLKVNGRLNQQMFQGIIDLEDPNIGFDFDGLVDFNDSTLIFDFSASIKNAYLSRLGFFPDRPDDSHLSTDLSIKVKGDSFAELLGIIKLDDVVLIENDSIYDFNDIRIGTYQQMLGDRKIIVRSEIVDANIEGDFSTDEIDKVIYYLLKIYLPSYAAVTNSEKIITETYKVNWDISLKDISPVTRLFIPELQIPEGLFLSGKLNTEDSVFSIIGQSSKIQYMDFYGENWSFSNYREDENIILRTGFEKMVLIPPDKDDSTGLFRDHFNIQLNFYRDTIDYELGWDDIQNESDSLHYSIQGIADLSKYPEIDFSISDVNAFLNNTLWNISKDNYIKIDSNNNIVIHNMNFFSDSSYLKLDGSLSGDSTEAMAMNLNVSNFDFSFLNSFLKNYDIDLQGILSGEVELEMEKERLFFLVDLEVDQLKVNDNKMGNTKIKTEWIPQKEAISIDLLSSITTRRGKITNPLKVEGFYYPNSRTQNFDIQIDLNGLRLAVLNPFIKDFVDQASGFLSGNAMLKGTLDAPKINASIKMDRCEALIKYTNVLYYFDGSVDVDENLISFHNIILTDTKGGKATIEGGIKHKTFADFELDLTLKPEKFIIFNTNRLQNDMFYGNAVVSGDINVTGPVQHINILTFVRTNQGTEMSIPISSAMSVDDNTYVIFKEEHQDSLKNMKRKSSVVGLTMTLRMMMTPEGQVRIYLPGNIGNLIANGDGLITLGIDETGTMSLKGTYILEGGSFLLNLKNIISRKFTINKGSSITFNGDPMDAVLNVAATYQTRTTLNGLSLPLDSAILQQRTPVDCILRMTDELSDPQIKFSIGFPGLSEDVTSAIYGQLDTTNEVVMTQQAFSLLVVNTFSFNTSETSLGNTMASSGISMITNQINGWLSQISKDFDIGINYRPGDRLSSDEIGVALSTQLFNNRVTIDANVGYSGNSNTSRKASSVVGDVSVEVKITKDGRFTTKVFSRSNANDISKIGTSNEQGYTYGVGINYRKNFDKFKDIFSRTPEQKRLRAIQKAERKEKRMEKKAENNKTI